MHLWYFYNALLYTLRVLITIKFLFIQNIQFEVGPYAANVKVVFRLSLITALFNNLPRSKIRLYSSALKRVRVGIDRIQNTQVKSTRTQKCHNSETSNLISMSVKKTNKNDFLLSKNLSLIGTRSYLSFYKLDSYKNVNARKTTFWLHQNLAMFFWAVVTETTSVWLFLLL